MTAFLVALLLFAPAPAPTLDQARSEPNLERRAKLALESAAAAEREAETHYGAGDLEKVKAALSDMAAGVEVAHQALEQTGKSPRRHSGPFKSAEIKSQDILRRLGDLEKRMDADERAVVEGPRVKVQEIHDAWFDGIMSRKK